MDQISKEQDFALKIIGAIQDVLTNEESEHHITPEELRENTTDFFHALGNLAPGYLFNQMTGSQEKIIDFNHIMNRIFISIK